MLMPNAATATTRQHLDSSARAANSAAGSTARLLAPITNTKPKRKSGNIVRPFASPSVRARIRRSDISRRPPTPPRCAHNRRTRLSSWTAPRDRPLHQPLQRSNCNPRLQLRPDERRGHSSRASPLIRLHAVRALSAAGSKALCKLTVATRARP